MNSSIAWRHKNPERWKALQRAYYYRNREAILARQKPYTSAWEKRNKTKRSERRKERYRANKQHELAVNKQWRVDNPEKQRKASRDWKRNHRERARQLAKRSYWKNIEKRRLQSRKYSAAKNHRRRARERASKIDETGIKQWMSFLKQQQFVSCYYCKTRIRPADMEIDHILPIALGGAHAISNLCVSCMECNRSKNAKTPSDWVTTGQSIMNLW